MSCYGGFAEEYERIFPFRQEVYRFLLTHAGEAGSSVLDVGCGPGHYCGMFSRDGYRVRGIDLDSTMIEVAARSYPDASFSCIDMRNVELAGEGFRFVYAIGNVAAHLPGEAFAGFVGKVNAMLVHGGRWVVQVMNWDALMPLTCYEFPVRTIEGHDGALTFHRRYDAITSESLVFSISLRRAGAVLYSEQASLYPLSTEMYLQLHESAGFECLEVDADFSGAPLRQVPGSGLVMVFGKP
ncbi:MAG: class I SAM-dependent methyltransferase [Chlorobiaceae bacterium]|nr:class I SAM-dependent methyltransferase [Chlorobiaceae bacterium]